jgi:hypothetical protein
MRLALVISGLALVATVVVMALVFGPILIGSFRARQVLASGVPALARITGLKDTGTRVNYQPMIAIQLDVMPKDRPPFTAVADRVLTVIDANAFAVGRTLVVKYDPAHPDRVAIVGPAPQPAHPAP